jgi:hypothetical protein
LVIRSDGRRMSHSANIGREQVFEAGLSLSTQYTPAASRFQATATPFTPRSLRSAFSNTNEGLVALTEQRQPRFNLVVTHVGIDDQELGALGDGTEGDSPSWVGESVSALSRVTARPNRLAAFSSCEFES